MVDHDANDRISSKVTAPRTAVQLKKAPFDESESGPILGGTELSVSFAKTAPKFTLTPLK
jgi:hypothetical protein